MKKTLAFAAAGALLAVSGLVQAERSGEEVYNTKCMVCHMNGVAGAPKLGDKANWAPRIAKGIDDLADTSVKGGAAKGLNPGMPPKGTCMDCTDAELKAAVEYMVSKSQ